MKLVLRIALLIMLGVTLMPHAAYADGGHNNDECSQQSDDCGSGDDSNDHGRKKPKFQTKFFSE